MIGMNLQTLRKLHRYSQEEVAEKIGVSRQAVAKWEAGDTIPDIQNCNALAQLYNVTLDELINHTDNVGGALISPKGKHIFGIVTVGERGQIVIPKKARKVFDIKPGDRLLVLGDEEQGIAVLPTHYMMDVFSEALGKELMINPQYEEDADENSH